jgi:hypothetical protein
MTKFMVNAVIWLALMIMWVYVLETIALYHGW